MRALALTISVILVTLISTQVSAQEASSNVSCRIITGYGTAVGYGANKSIARENARELCGTKIIDGYFASRGSIDDSQVDDLALACVNLECQ